MAKERAGYILSGDIGGTNLKGGVIDPETGEIVFSKSIPTEAANGGQAVADRFSRLLLDIVTEGPAAADDFLAIGYDTPGIVDPKTGIILDSCQNIPGFIGLELPRQLRERFGLPVFVLNDAKSFTLAEAKYGAGRGLMDFGLWTLGTGIGGGLFLEGRLYLGANSSAGELGHLEIDPEGPHCNQGHRGCVESYAGKRAIVDLYRTKVGLSGQAEVEVRSVFKEAEKGDGLCLEVVSEVAGHLARGVGAIVKMLDLQAAIFGGKIASEDFFLSMIEKMISDNLYRTQKERFRVLRAKYHDDGGFLGAAAYAWDRVNNG